MEMRETNRVIRDLFENRLSFNESMLSWARNYQAYSNNYFIWDIQGKEPITPTKTINKHKMT
jgi:hypothetical protein